MGIFQKFKSKSVKSDRNSADPNGLRNVYCIECGSKKLRYLGKGVYSSRVKLECENCGCIFEISEDEEYIEDYGGFEFVDGITTEKHGNTNELDAVRRYAVREFPELKKIAYDKEVFDWYTDYWNFIKWNEHGNEPGLSELATDGDFANSLMEIESGYAGDIHEYLDDYYDDSDGKKLSDRLDAIEKKYGKMRNNNKRRGKR